MAKTKTEARQSETLGLLYRELLAKADPKTGRVYVSGDMAKDILGLGSRSTGRIYLTALCQTGKLVQIGEIKCGAATLYRIPALCKGDTLTYYEEAAKVSKEVEVPKETEAPKEAPDEEPNCQDTMPIALKDDDVALARLKMVVDDSDRFLTEVLHQYLNLRGAVKSYLGTR